MPGAGSEFGTDRAGILFCSQCGDEYCGLDSVTISESAGTVTWRGLYKTWYEFFLMGDGRAGHGIWHHESGRPEVVFQFEAGQYRQAVASLRELIGTMQAWPNPDDHGPELSS